MSTSINTADSHSCEDPAEHEYVDLLDTIRNRIAGIKGPVFTTNAADLFGVFLDNLPPERRQHYTCNACRRFLERFGGLVSIDEHGRTVPLVWDPSAAVGIMVSPVQALHKRVCGAKVTGVFIASDKVWGQPVTGPWRHMAGTPPASIVYTGRTLNAGQRMAELVQDYQTLGRGLAEYPEQAADVALELLDSDDLYRSERIVGPARWLKALHVARNGKRGSARDNVTWLAVATAPAGFCHVKSTMIGTLLDDIVAGKSFDEVSRSFAAKMHPLRYQRPQALPSAGAIAEAERIVETLKSAGALRRQYARLDDLEVVWVPAQIEPPEPGSVFGHLKTKGEAPPMTRALEGRPAKPIAWSTFAADVLPGAERIEVQVTHSRMGFYAFVTASDPDAPPILQWDREDRRNPVSWYTHHGGSAASEWSTTPGWHAVSAVSLFPFQWGDLGDTFERHTPGALFVVDGCRPTQNGSGLFPELLRGEYHGIRRVIEQYAQQAEVEGRDEASACGLVVRKGGSVLTVRVHGDGAHRDYLVSWASA